MSNARDFEIKNGVLIKYKGSGGDVVIPYGVTRIRESAFKNCSSILSLSILDSNVSIDRHALENCCSIKRLTVPHWTHSIEKLILPDNCAVSCTEDEITSIPANRRSNAAMGFALIPDKDMTSDWAKSYLNYIEKHANELIDAAFRETALLKMMCDYQLLPTKDFNSYLAKAEQCKNPMINELLLAYKDKIGADTIEAIEAENEIEKSQISKGVKRKITIALSVAALLIIIFLAATSTYRTLNKEVQSESAAVGLENVTVSAWTEHHSAGDYHFTFNYYNINCSNFDMYSIEEKINVFNAVRGVTINSKTTYLLNNIISNGNTYSYDSSKRRLYKNGSVIYDDYLNSQAYAEYLKNHPEEDPSLRKVTCEMCKGSGKVRYYYGESALEAFLDGYPDYEYGPCPNCEGKGYFFEKK
ncbi:MAG: leucine-rich repeat protein [Oscillospiraceae bacterium]|nr:leucine-rich repeat protein [Oscillospiraceae bacterium]